MRSVIGRVAGFSIGIQFSLVIAVLLVPLLLITGMLVQSQNEAVTFAAKELRGTRLANTVWSGVLAAARSDLETLKQTGAKLKREGLAEAGEFNAEAALKAFVDAAAGGNVGQAVATGASAIQKIADGSNLTLDPDLDSYYVMDLAIARLPQLAAATVELRDALGPMGKQGNGLAEFQSLVVARAHYASVLEAVQGSLASALAANGDKSLARSFGPVGDSLLSVGRKLDGEVASRISDMVRGAPAGPAVPAPDGMFREMESLAQVAYADLPRLLEARIATVHARLATEIAFIAAAVALALGLAWLVINSIRRPVSDIVDVLRQFQSGDFKGEVRHTEKNNEVGAIARAVLKAQETGEQAALTVAALNQSPAMLMITDPDERIVFISLSLNHLLTQLEPVFRAARHDFSVARMTRQHIDYYRTNPALRRTLILDDGKSRKAKYEIGGLTILVDMAYIHGIDGERIGHILLWTNVTEELLGEAEVAAVVHAAQAGDFSGRLALDNKQGFVREIANGLNNVSTLVETAIGECAGVMDKVAQGDLTLRIETAYGGMLGSLRDSINSTIGRLADTVVTIQTTATDVASAANEISSGASNLAERTEQQASALEQTAATTEELAASVKSSALASRKGVEMAQEAQGVAEAGGGIVRKAVEAMSRIEQASQRISDISTVIDEIAFQTNLLALNAAVEAARAGEAGKGFAVVASEVRTLAQRSSDAAKDITALINSSTAEVETGVKLVRSAGEVLDQMVDASRKVAGTITEISSASGEQAAGIDEMSQAVAHMDEMTQQNAALAEESAASANALSAQIRHLNELVSSFRIEAASPVGSRSGQARRDDAPHRLAYARAS